MIMKKREEARKKYGDLMTKWEEEQNHLISKLVMHDDFDVQKVKYIGGVDISFGEGDSAVAALCVLDITTKKMKVVYEDYKDVILQLPYIPTFLAFREIHPILSLIERLKQNSPQFLPDIIMVDGNGVLHPRKLGIAAHLGIVSNIPCIGVSKKFLVVDGWTREDVDDLKNNKFKKEGDFEEIIGKTDGFCYGAAYRGKSKVPIYISVGNRISLKTAIEIVKKTSIYRIPQPIREADLRSRDIIRKRKKKEQEKKLKEVEDEGEN